MHLEQQVHGRTLCITVTVYILYIHSYIYDIWLVSHQGKSTDLIWLVVLKLPSAEGIYRTYGKAVCCPTAPSAEGPSASVAARIDCKFCGICNLKMGDATWTCEIITRCTERLLYYAAGVGQMTSYGFQFPDTQTKPNKHQCGTKTTHSVPETSEIHGMNPAPD